MMETILITGGAGFIGSHLADALLAKGYRVVVVDDLSTGSLGNLPLSDDKMTFYEKSVTDKEFMKTLFKEYSFDYIFHYAAVASVQRSVEEPIVTHAVNFDSTLELLEAARGIPTLKRFLFVSSAAVYGDRPSLPSCEEDGVNPITPYGVDKYASERYVLNAAALYGVPGIAMRYFNVYGPRQNPASPYSGVLSIFSKAFQEMEEPLLNIYGDGENTRDFIYVKDVVAANLLLMEENIAVGNVYNVGTGREVSLRQIVKAMESSFGKKAALNFEEPRYGDIRHSVASIKKIEALGFKPSYDIARGLAEYRDFICDLSV